jgi:hypothetical protein
MVDSKGGRGSAEMYDHHMKGLNQPPVEGAEDMSIDGDALELSEIISVEAEALHGVEPA